MSEVEIIDAGVEHLEGLRPLFLALHDHHRRVSAVPVIESDDRAWAARRATYAEFLGDGVAFLHIARREAVPIGYAFTILRAGTDDTFALAPRYAELYTLSVAPAERGSGIGGLLLDAVDGALADVAITKLTVAVMIDNDDAIRLYRRRGLVPGELILYRIGSRAGS